MVASDRPAQVSTEVQDEALARSVLLRRVVAAFALLLVALTWRLWTPQVVFPQVPLLALAIAAAPLVRLAWTGVHGLRAAIGMLLAPARSQWWRPACLTFALVWLAMTLLDQHRLQPWTYQFALVAMVLATCPAAWALRLLRALTISIYCYSALSKLDHTFLFTLGQQLLAAGLGIVGISTETWPADSQVAGAAAFPLGEIVVAVLLVSTHTRRFGLAAAIAMHAALLLVLGPLGLGHQPGVLAWNLFFIVQDCILFRRCKASSASGLQPPIKPATTAELSAGSATRRARFSPQQLSTVFGTGIIALAMLLSALEPWGWLDHWPAWAVYAPQGGYVTLLVAADSAGQLPEEVQQHLTTEADEQGYLRLRIDRWSLAALGSPIYPQTRFQLGVAQEVIERYDLEFASQVVLHGPADRWTGARSEELLIDSAALEQAQAGYWLNARPRQSDAQREWAK